MSYVSVSVDVNVDEIIEDLSKSDRADLIAKLLEDTAVPFGLGDGDTSRATNIIERAFLAAQKIPNIPAELKDLFWVVHGRAMA